MEASWHTYLTQFDKDLASVAVDTKAADRSASRLGHLIILRIKAIKFRTNGLPAQEDFDDIYNLEDRIQAELVGEETNYVGRLVVCGSYFLHLYTSQPQRDLERIKALVAGLKDRQTEVEVKSDQEWKTYRDVLYPTPEDWQQIKDGEVLNTLQKHGDDLSKPRQVDHWLFFSNAQGRDGAAERLVAQGFTIICRRDPDECHKQWTLQVQRCDSVQSQDITHLTISLLHLAKEFGGDYDGWETSVEK